MLASKHMTAGATSAGPRLARSVPFARRLVKANVAAPLNSVAVPQQQPLKDDRGFVLKVGYP